MNEYKSTLRAIIHSSDLENLSSWNNTSDSDFLSITHNESFLKLASFSYPHTLLKKNKTEISCSYFFADQTQFKITLTEQDCKVFTPLLGELQVFYYKIDNTLYLADSLFELIEMIPINNRPGLNLTGVLEYCARNPSLKTRTIFNNVHLLSENMVLTWKKSTVNLTIQKPVADQIKKFPTPQNKLEAINKISSLLISQISQIPPNLKKVSSLSGGTDSAIISHIASKHGCNNFSTILLSGKSAENQAKQLEKLSKFISGNFLISKSDNQPILLSDEKWQLDPYINGYLSINFPLIEQSREQNCEIELNGLGGDDFFFYSQKNASQRKQKSQTINEITKYFSDLGKSHFSLELTPDDSKNITSLLPPNISQSLLQTSVPWRNAGIWPISPFVSATIISYSLHLPKEMMYDKSVLHSYLENNFNMATPKKKDSFTAYFSENLEKLAKELGTEFYENSLLFSSKLFNNSEIINLVKSVSSHSNNSTNSEKIFLLFFTRLEKYFQYLYTPEKLIDHS